MLHFLPPPVRMGVWSAFLLLTLTGPRDILAATSDAPLDSILARLDALERQNRDMALQIETLMRQNAALESARGAAPAATLGAPTTAGTQAATASQSGTVAKTTAPTPDDWTSRVRLGGDLRYRHENIDDGAAPEDRTRETVRARMAAAIRFTESIDGEIGFATGSPDPRGSSATLGAASTKKSVGMDLGYVRWRPMDGLAVIAGKMRQPFERPGLSVFIDNEIRPEGLAVTVDGPHGLFGSAYSYWLEERPGSTDSKLHGGQFGWSASSDTMKFQGGVGYSDYAGIQGQSPNFANGTVNEFGNSVTGTGDDERYLYDYDIGQLFADFTWLAGRFPVNVYADYAHNFAADDGLDDALAIGVLVGKADAPGRWEAGVLYQAVEKDALFGHWTDSDFAGGVTDNEGESYRVAWMPLKRVLLNLTYLDTAYQVEVGDETDYDRWQLDFNFLF